MVSSVRSAWTKTEVNGGRVQPFADQVGWRLSLPPTRRGYANAQLDDYQRPNGSEFGWLPETRLALRARFSAGEGQLLGTAGFGFWNAPFGPGTGLRVRLPRAVWFFYASDASDLPLAPFDERGNGWFVSTIDVMRARVLRWTLLAVPTLALNQFRRLRRLLWPLIRRDMRISFERVAVDMQDWHDYEICWRHDRTLFFVDGRPLLVTPMSPRGPLGFVTWIDNQAMVARPTGRISWKSQLGEAQWMEMTRITLENAP